MDECNSETDQGGKFMTESCLECGVALAGAHILIRGEWGAGVVDAAGCVQVSLIRDFMLSYPGLGQQTVFCDQNAVRPGPSKLDGMRIAFGPAMPCTHLRVRA